MIINKRFFCTISVKSLGLSKHFWAHSFHQQRRNKTECSVLELGCFLIDFLLSPEGLCFQFMKSCLCLLFFLKFLPWCSQVWWWATLEQVSWSASNDVCRGVMEFWRKIDIFSLRLAYCLAISRINLSMERIPLHSSASFGCTNVSCRHYG